MTGFLSAVITGVTSFIATNIDDIFLLTIFYSQLNANFRPRHIIAGQYLGFAILPGISALGLLGAMVISREWIGLLGFAPIYMGVHKLFQRRELAKDQRTVESQELADAAHRSRIGSLLSPNTYSVAAVTIANGGDNISVYIPLFASGGLAWTVIIMAVFLACIALWCYLGMKLAAHPAITCGIERFGHILVPLVLIGLGIFILWESHSLSLLARLMQMGCASFL